MRIHMKKAAVTVLVISLLFSLLCGVCPQVFAAETQTGVIYGLNVSGRLNIRADAGTTYSVLGYLTNGDTVTILGTKKNEDTTWYKITTEDGDPVDSSHKGAINGYVSSEYVKIQIEYKPDADFEAYLTAQKFPASYKDALRELHAQYPKWVFVAQHLPMTWSEALAAEAKVGRNLVSSGAKASWKSMEYGAYDWKNKKYNVFDSGGWVSAQRQVIAYYMDPRNFLDDTSIFQFESLSYSTVHNTAGVKKILAGSFMEDIAATFVSAAKTTGVSAYHLASRALQEQGTKGNALGHGTVEGYKGYYNIFDIGAYASGGLTAMQNGAIYAKSKGWNTVKKSIVGGGEQLGKGYIAKAQDTLYLQKFDFVDGGNGYYNHQYMTNVSAAASEAKIMKKAYTEEMLNSALVFNIPVFSGMPSKASVCPTSDGNNDNTLTALSVEGYTITPTFSRYTTDYAVTLPKDVKTATVKATASDKGATVTGAGEIKLYGEDMEVQVRVKAPSGYTRTYTVHIYRPGAEEVKDNTLRTLSIKGYALTPKFSEFVTDYAVTLPADVDKVTVEGAVKDENATVTGLGEVKLSGVDTAVKVKVKGGESGVVRTYTIHVYRPGADGKPLIGDTKYKIGKEYITGISPGTKADAFIKAIPVTGGTLQVIDANKKAVTDKIGTGHKVQVLFGKEVYTSYTAIIYGDVSGDGAVTSRDLLMAQKHILGVSKLSGAAFVAADTGKDGKLTTSDLLRAQKQILGISSPIL